uniref:Nucleolar protein 8 n=1 Tax=Callorhinchus milii TaxID=7868 RepID=A0A4W3HVL5_CALMI|eukprot:gi/632980516/ref/XP_007907077.1/ PREDICTED: nucleolar protein 8 [Callorhinchus milii]
METDKSLKRVFVGGLHHTVAESEIKERFSKFGDVMNVEIIIRKDDKGNPVKTFGYINMSSSEKELKKCISLLNKSNWKGGTLQIELAKESFLHKLVQERQDAAKNKNKPQVDSKAQVVESLKKAGVENFHLKSAVPGTEISGHKNWVVSKFGRVLPILHLRPNGQNRLIKCDPSKYCHNIKKLDNSSELETQTPITELTWKMEERDDESSKKRRGDFTASKRTFKSRISVNDCNKGHSSASCFESNVSPKKMSSAAVKYNAQRESAKGQLEVLKGKELIALKSDSVNRNVSTSTNKRNVWSKARMAHNDSESEEELKLLIETEKNKMKELGQMTAATQDVYHLEVVGEDYIPKYNSHWSLNVSKKAGSKASGTDQRAGTDDGEYDSADTDEIIAAKRTPAKIIPKMQSTGEEKSMTKSNLQKEACELISDSGEESEEVDSESSLESDYEEMMNNCYRIDLSLADLEQLVNNSSKSETEGSEDSSLEPSTSGIEIPHSLQAVTMNTASHSAKSAIQSEESSEDEITENKRLNVVQLPPFRGTKCLSVVQEKRPNKAEQTTDHFVLKEKRKISQKSCDDSTSAPVLKKKKVNKINTVSDSDSDMDCSYKPPPFRGTKSLQITLTADPPNQVLNPTESEGKSCTSNLLNHNGRSDSKEVESGKETIVPVNSRDSQRLKATPAQAINKIVTANSLKSENGTVSHSTETAAGCVVSRMSGNLDKHSLDNQKRLAALQQRKEETKMQKSLIQGALSNVDSPKSGYGNHIVFDSEEESENEQNEVQNKVLLEDEDDSADDSEEEDNAEEKDGEPPAEESGRSQRKLPGASKEFKIKTIGKLFDSSEDEGMNIDDENHDDIFKIKPQFEGKAGQKLLALQSRFGTDERFRMDERFLENDEESSEEADTGEKQTAEKDELAVEKKRNLDILQGLLQVSVKMPELKKEQAKAKKFRDVSALHYDPTREDHAVFETKVETKKQSKAERRKIREAVEKLPEVSKETYFDVAVNLKEIFSSSTEDKGNTEEKKKEDDQHQKEAAKSHEDSSAQQIASVIPNNTPKEESTGFKFSFFGMEATVTAPKEELYKAESLNVAKVSWTEDPRFQDSSSEEEEEDLKGQDDTRAQSAAPLLEKNINFFFFFKDDQRLKDGPELFCHTADLEVERNDWEEKRSSLIEEYRKKHKDARRKVKEKRYMGVLGEMYK